jgi:hypothetical protein
MFVVVVTIFAGESSAINHLARFIHYSRNCFQSVGFPTICSSFTPITTTVSYTQKLDLVAFDVFCILFIRPQSSFLISVRFNRALKFYKRFDRIKQFPSLISAEIMATSYVQHLYLGFYWLAMSNAMVNPIIYYWMNGK